MNPKRPHSCLRVPSGDVGTRRFPPSRRQRGFQLVELVVVLAILSLALTAGIPRAQEWARRLKVDLAANELVAVLRLSRSYAVRHGTKVGVKFWVDDTGSVSFALHRDGDGDGVLTADILSGDDPPVGPSRRLAHFGRQVTFGFPPGPAPRDPGNPRRRLDRLDDPIRFNRSDIASFNHLGGSTPGSLYLTDGRRLLSVVRLFGRTSKVKVMRYDQEAEQWR